MTKDGMAFQGFDAFLFDMDGTILDSSIAAERAWSAWARDHGVPKPAYHGRRVADIVVSLGFEGADRQRASDDLTARELADVSGVVEIPGAAVFLSLLPQDRWGVVTSAPRALALRRIGAAGLPEPRHLIAAEDVTTGKPSPDPFLAGAALLSVDATRCLAFEDADAGILAAEAAGCSVMVISGTGTATLSGRRSVPDYKNIRPVFTERTLRLHPID